MNKTLIDVLTSIATATILVLAIPFLVVGFVIAVIVDMTEHIGR